MRNAAIPILAVVLCSACATPRPWLTNLDADHRLVDTIWDVSAQTAIDESTLHARLAQHRFVMLGESHDNPDHHALQAQAIERLSSDGRSPPVVFEMLETDLQSRIDQLQQEAPDNVDHFGVAVDWANSGWPAFTMYRPIFAAVMQRRLKIVAASLSRKDAYAIAKKEKTLDPALVERHALLDPLPDAVRAGLIDELREAHCGHMPDSMIEPMVDFQRARDALLADKLERYANSGGAVLVAGREHVRQDRGAPIYLARRGQASIVSLAFVEVQSKLHTVADYNKAYKADQMPFDYVWFTPRANDVSHCDELKRNMDAIKKRKKGG